MASGADPRLQGRFPAQTVAQVVSICRVAEAEYDNYGGNFNMMHRNIVPHKHAAGPWKMLTTSRLCFAAHYENLTAIASKAQDLYYQKVDQSMADSRTSAPPLPGAARSAASACPCPPSSLVLQPSPPCSAPSARRAPLCPEASPVGTRYCCPLWRIRR